MGEDWPMMGRDLTESPDCGCGALTIASIGVASVNVTPAPIFSSAPAELIVSANAAITISIIPSVAGGATFDRI